MQVILSHVNTDFDALASMFAAKKLYPDAIVVMSDKQNDAVKQFLAIYRDTLEFVSEQQIDWSNVTKLILVDVASLRRIGSCRDKLNLGQLKIVVFDHHPTKEGDVQKDEGAIEQVGATVTLLVEEIIRRKVPISPFEATLFGLGLYTDTGSFNYSTTTVRDFQVASFLMEKGMNLDIIQRFSDQMLYQDQQEIFNQLFLQSNEHELDGLHIVVSSYQQKKYQGGLATLTRKLLEMSGADAVLTIVKMHKRVYIVGRASSERINFLPLLSNWEGGGHEQAASATIKDAELESIVSEVTDNLKLIVKPAVTARDIMTYPVKSLPPETTIEEAGKLMYRYGHTGFPIVQDEKLLGIISRRDLEKATHHGLGHAPVKAYMSSNVISVEPNTSVEEIQKIMIKHDIGRLPVVERGKLIGILSRTDIIEFLHNRSFKEQWQQTDMSSDAMATVELRERMKRELPHNVFLLLEEIGRIATETKQSIYLIGGIVRDILLGRENDDIDLVVEGDAISFSEHLVSKMGGEVIPHEEFGTANWYHPSGLRIDLTSARLEYYEHPAALPHVELTTLKEDLYRRDFSINAMAICINKEKFGQLVDPFQGYNDLKDKTIRILHNLSFVEDPTRILRAIRFEVRFQFLMDEQTRKLALTSIEKIKALSRERIKHELEKLFHEASPANSLKRLFELQFWQQWGLESSWLHASYSHALQLENVLHNEIVKGICKDVAKWFMFFLIPFYQADRLEHAQTFATTKREKKLLNEINELKKSNVLSNSNPLPTHKPLGNVHRILKNYTDDVILFYLANLDPETQQTLLDYIMKRNQLPSFLTGEDLKKCRLKPGPIFSELLSELEIATLNEEVTSTKEAYDWLNQQLRNLDSNKES